MLIDQTLYKLLLHSKTPFHNHPPPQKTYYINKTACPTKHNDLVVS